MNIEKAQHLVNKSKRLFDDKKLYEQEVKAFVSEQPLLSEDSFWESIDVLLSVKEEFSKIEPEDPELFIDEFYRLASVKNWDTFEHAIRFQRTYSQKVKALYKPCFDNIKGLGEDGYCDILDTFPLLGREEYEAALAGKNYGEINEITSPYYFGEWYMDTRMEEAWIKRFGSTLEKHLAEKKVIERFEDENTRKHDGYKDIQYNYDRISLLEYRRESILLGRLDLLEKGIREKDLKIFLKTEDVFRIGRTTDFQKLVPTASLIIREQEHSIYMDVQNSSLFLTIVVGNLIDKIEIFDSLFYGFSKEFLRYVSENFLTKVAWTRSNSALRFGFSDELIGAEFPSTFLEDLEHIKLYRITTARGDRIIDTHGAIVGSDLNTVRQDILSCKAGLLQEQIMKSKADSKRVKLLSREEFDKVYK